MLALQNQYEQRIENLEAELTTAKEAKESLEASYRQLKKDKVQNVCDSMQYMYTFNAMICVSCIQASYLGVNIYAGSYR